MGHPRHRSQHSFKVISILIGHLALPTVSHAGLPAVVERVVVEGAERTGEATRAAKQVAEGAARGTLLEGQKSSQASALTRAMQEALEAEAKMIEQSLKSKRSMVLQLELNAPIFRHNIEMRKRWLEELQDIIKGRASPYQSQQDAANLKMIEMRRRLGLSISLSPEGAQAQFTREMQESQKAMETQARMIQDAKVEISGLESKQKNLPALPPLRRIEFLAEAVSRGAPGAPLIELHRGTQDTQSLIIALERALDKVSREIPPTLAKIRLTPAEAREFQDIAKALNLSVTDAEAFRAMNRADRYEIYGRAIKRKPPTTGPEEFMMARRMDRLEELIGGSRLRPASEEPASEFQKAFAQLEELRNGSAPKAVEDSAVTARNTAKPVTEEAKNSTPSSNAPPTRAAR